METRGRCLRELAPGMERKEASCRGDLAWVRERSVKGKQGDLGGETGCLIARGLWLLKSC